jgi:hypothetical protein
MPRGRWSCAVAQAPLGLYYRAVPSPVVPGGEAVVFATSMTVLLMPYMTTPSTIIMVTMPTTKGMALSPAEAFVLVLGRLVQRRP